VGKGARRRPAVGAAIVTVGDELLAGITLDTNAHWLATRLTGLGFTVRSVGTVADEPAAIVEAVAAAARRAKVVLVTGGLGPTRDDRTFEALAKLTGSPLTTRADVAEALRRRFASRGVPMPAANLRQARLPRSADVIPNPWGTAPAIRMRTGGSLVFALPGVPGEMRSLFEDAIRPQLESRFRELAPRILERLRVVALAEAEIASRLAPVSVPRGVRVSYLPSGAEVDLRLSGAAVDRTSLGRYARAVIRRLVPHIYERGNRSLAEVVIEALRERGESLALAESCTGGLLGGRLTAVAGSSDVLWGGWVTYANDAKIQEVGVPARSLAAHGAVSVEVAVAMADGARRAASTSHGIGITGIAGPGGGTPTKPVGTVVIAWTRRGAPTLHRVFRFDGNRDAVREQAVSLALDGLRRAVLGLPELEA